MIIFWNLWIVSRHPVKYIFVSFWSMLWHDMGRNIRMGLSCFVPNPPLSIKEYKATTMKLRGCRVRTKMFHMRYVTWDNAVWWRGNYVIISEQSPSWIRHLGFMTFVLRQKNTKTGNFQLENMPVIIWLPWKHHVPCTMTCHTKLFPDKFQVKSESLMGFA